MNMPMLILPTLTYSSESGTSEALREGMVTRAVGFSIAENQNVPTITATQSGLAPTTTAVAAAALAGSEVISLNNGAGALPTQLPAQGALFTIAGDTQQYAIAEINDNEPLDVGATSMKVRISPALKLPAAANAALTFLGAHTANVAFARNAVVFASRPLLDINAGGDIIESISDPITGVTFRLELVRQNKQTYFSLDCLWGSKVIRPEQVVRIYG
jgi:P22 coat protein - gene protein 5